MSAHSHHNITILVSILFFFIISNLACQKDERTITKISFWAMGIEGESIEKLLPIFHEKYPHIRVKVQMFPWTAAQEKLITAYASDNLPDAFQLGNTWIPQFVSLDAVEKLDTWLETSHIIKKENYFTGIWDTNLLNDYLYGIPWYIDTRVLFYRTDILSKAGYRSPPKSWDELYKTCQQVKHLLNDPNKYAIYLPTNEWATFIIFGLQAGANLLKDNNTYGNFSSEEFKRAFDFLIKFHKEDLAPTGITEVTNVYQAFANEYFSMYISGPWNIPDFKKWMTGELADKWTSVPLPGPGDNYPGISLAGGSSLVMNKNSGKKEAVWQFFEYLSLPQTQIKFYHLVSDLPAVKNAWEDSTFRNDPYMAAFYKQFHHVVPTPKIPEWEQIAFSKVQQYAEYAARNVMSTQEALNSLDQDVNRILEKRRWLLGKKD